MKYKESREQCKMERVAVENIFTDEDKRFNRFLVDCALESQQKKNIPDRRGGKMSMGNHLEYGLLKDRNYEFTSEVLTQFRKKWGISE